MIYARVNEDGTETLLTPEEARRVNKLAGLTDVDQNFIRAINAGEITGDCIELEEDDTKQTILPFQPRPVD